jgi:Iron permease FTR1 family
MNRHVNCCNPEDTSNGGWGIFNAILGWQNSATIGSVVSYCVYWIVVTLALIIMRTDERRVSRGEATLWRKLLRKGPKVPKASTEAVSESPGELDDTKDGNSGKAAPIGMQRDIQNLTV